MRVWVSPTAHSITCDIKGGGDFRRATPEKRLSQSQRRGTPYNGLYKEALPHPTPKGIPFSGLRYIKG